MSSEKLTSLLRAKPFNPFRMKLLDGREFVVDYKRQIAMMPTDSTCVFFEQGEADSYFTIIGLDAIATIDVRKLPKPIRDYLNQQDD